MPAAAAALAPSLIASGAKTALGLGQLIRGKQLQNQLDRPDRDEVASMREFLDSTQSALAEDAPGANFARNQIDRNTASTLRTARTAAPSGAALSSLVAGAQEGANQATAQETARQEQNQEMRRRIRQRALRQKGLAQMRDWDWNQRGKFEEEAAAAEGMLGAGLQNIVPGMGGIESALTESGRPILKQKGI